MKQRGVRARATSIKAEPNRAAIYARFSDRSQGTENNAAISEQLGEIETHCNERGLTIDASYNEVGRNWSKKRADPREDAGRRSQGAFQRHRLLEVGSHQ